MPVSFRKKETAKAASAKAPQKRNGKPEFISARLLPMGGEMNEPRREKVNATPRAVPAYVAPTSLVSISVVKKTAINPSRTIPAIITEGHTSGPLPIDNRATPIVVISIASRMTVFLEPSLLDNKTIGMVAVRLAAWKLAAAPSAPAVVHPASR